VRIVASPKVPQGTVVSQPFGLLPRAICSSHWKVTFTIRPTKRQLRTNIRAPSRASFCPAFFSPKLRRINEPP
jgi:hypothetical protein